MAKEQGPHGAEGILGAEQELAGNGAGEAPAARPRIPEHAAQQARWVARARRALPRARSCARAPRADAPAYRDLIHPEHVGEARHILINTAAIWRAMVETRRPTPPTASLLTHGRHRAFLQKRQSA